jgi:hypothetical protein
VRRSPTPARGLADALAGLVEPGVDRLGQGLAGGELVVELGGALTQVRTGGIEFLNIAGSVISTVASGAAITNVGFAFP